MILYMRHSTRNPEANPWNVLAISWYPNTQSQTDSIPIHSRFITLNPSFRDIVQHQHQRTTPCARLGLVFGVFSSRQIHVTQSIYYNVRLKTAEGRHWNI